MNSETGKKRLKITKLGMICLSFTIIGSMFCILMIIYYQSIAFIPPLILVAIFSVAFYIGDRELLWKKEI